MHKHILIIDDDRVVLSIAKDILNDAGYKVSTAESGVYANHIIYSKTPPSLILMDVMMPLMSGIRKTQILKQREKSQLIPVVLISSKEEPELQRLVTEARADGYLPKPFTADNLVAKVKQVLAA